MFWHCSLYKIIFCKAPSRHFLLTSRNRSRVGGCGLVRHLQYWLICTAGSSNYWNSLELGQGDPIFAALTWIHGPSNRSLLSRWQYCETKVLHPWFEKSSLHKFLKHLQLFARYNSRRIAFDWARADRLFGNRSHI